MPASPSLLLVSAPFHWPYSPATSLQPMTGVAGLLRVRRDRPRHRRAAEQRDEIATLHVWMAPAWQEIIWRACVDGPRLARDHLACSAEVACSHVSGLLVQSGWTAGPDGVREPSPHHSNGIDVPMK